MVVCLAAAALLGFAPALFMLGSTMRYLADLTPCLMPLAMIGLWDCGRRVAARKVLRRVFYPAVGAIALYTVGVGLLLAVTGYYDHFRSFNPDLFARLSYRTLPADTSASE